ncbi:MAG: hypothetical protein AAFU54_11335 [Chloroflexota bacterium]
MRRKILRRLGMALAIICSVWIIFPLLNLVLWLFGLIAITSPPGPPPVNDYHAQRQTIVVGCEDITHQLPAYPGTYPDYNPGHNFLDEETLPAQARVARVADYVLPPLSQAFKYSMRESLRLAARRSRAIGSDLAADNLEHFLNNSGETMTDFNVEGLLTDLPALNDYVTQTLNTSVSALAEQQLAEPSPGSCRQFSSTDTPWVIGRLNGDPNIMPNLHDIGAISTPFSSTFHLLYREGDYAHRDELDVWMAMEPIWFSTGESVIANTETGQAEVCYRVFIYFPYRWFDAAFVDHVIGLTDAWGISENYVIEGTSGVRCEGFRTDGNYAFAGLLSE